MPRRRGVTLVRVQELAKQYRVKPDTVYKWIRRGLLNEEHGLMRVGGIWLISIKVFEKTFTTVRSSGNRVTRAVLRPRVSDDSGSGTPFESFAPNSLQPHFVGEIDTQTRIAATGR